MSEVGGGWGIRKKLDNNTLYTVAKDTVLPPSNGWKVFLTEGKDPSPTLKSISKDELAGLKRRHVMTQERAWKQRKFTDAEIVCGDVRTAVHRMMLAAASPVFEAALSSAMVEGRSATYEISDVTPSAVEAMLAHIYTGNIQCQSAELPALFELAMKYELDALGEDVAAKMVQDVSAENVRRLVVVLKRHSENKFAKGALTHIFEAARLDCKNELMFAMI